MTILVSLSVMTTILDRTVAETRLIELTPPTPIHQYSESSTIHNSIDHIHRLRPRSIEFFQHELTNKLNTLRHAFLQQGQQAAYFYNPHRFQKPYPRQDLHPRQNSRKKGIYFNG